MGNVEGLPRKLSAQDKYAQEVLDWLWMHQEDMLEETGGELYYRGSIHMLVKKVTPRAQAGDVTNILRTSGAISSAAHGIWRINRKSVFVDEYGLPVDVAIEYGHSTKSQQFSVQLADYNKRLTKLEEQVEALTSAVIELAKGVDRVARSQASEEPGPEEQAS